MRNANKHRMGNGRGMMSFGHNEGRDNELTPDQTCKRLDDPSVPFTCERTLLNFCLHPKCMTQSLDHKHSHDHLTGIEEAG
jgi:hypothetical protein